MDRRGFLGRLAGVIAAPLAVVGLRKARPKIGDTVRVRERYVSEDTWWLVDARWVPREEIIARYGGR